MKELWTGEKGRGKKRGNPGENFHKKAQEKKIKKKEKTWGEKPMWRKKMAGRRHEGDGPNSRGLP